MKYFTSLKYLKNWVNCQVCNDDYRITKQLLSTLKREENSTAIVKDRIKTFLRILKMPLCLKIEKKNTKNIVYDSYGSKPVIIKYIKNYDNRGKLFFLSTSVTEPIYVNSIIDFLRFVKYYLFALKDTLFLISIFNKISTKEFSYYIYLKTKILLYSPQKIYVWAPRAPEANLIALFFSNCKKIKIDMIMGGNLQFFQRYGSYQNVKLCFTSMITEEEYKSFCKIGWINSNNVEILITGNVEQINRDKNMNSFLYDVGMYSSAIWARDGLERCYNKDKIIKNKENYCKNPYAKIEMIILNNLIIMAKKYNFSLKIYLHPYEKELINTYNIYPPYWDYIDCKNISIDRDLTNKNDFYDVKVAIVLMSAIFYDRWDKNLVTLCFDTKKIKNMIGVPLKYLGVYSKYGFKNLKELEQKTINQLEIREKS